ncbi:transposase [Thioalkalivibrio sp. ALM2T]|uniref:transposase n=1 Tax=Thioalkalivibrio sp. ALM2T TaxID=1158184 RepID=UPI0018C93C43|nr:transposase [Thioalkalivibrio sp. ALM2T]
MPRMARVVLPHFPHHVVQRGHNRQVVFAGDEDYERYLEDLRELSSVLEVRVYAYCLMTNHVHLLLGPGEEVAAMGRLMKALAARATRYRNRLEGRSGTLWEGRYKSSPVQTETYLLACARYIELNPVRARMVVAPGDYAWSSYRQRMGEAECWLDLDPAYLDLGRSGPERRLRYARFVQEGVPENELTLMREALQRGQLTGNDRFVDEVEQIIGSRIERRRPGRPASRGA